MAKVSYILNCTTGLEQIVADAIVSDLGQLTVVAIEPGFIGAETNSGSLAARVKRLPYISSALEVIATNGDRSLSGAAADFSIQGARMPVRKRTGGRSFRLRVFDAGQPSAIDKEEKIKLERALQRTLNMRCDPGRGEIEVWVLRRRGATVNYLAVRLDVPDRRRAQAGSLKPDLAGALVRAVELDRTETVWDPFAGSGSLAAARSKYPVGTLLVSDFAPEQVQHLRSSANNGAFGEQSKVFRFDFLARSPTGLPIQPASVDTFVTDPPWGAYKHVGDGDLVGLYESFWSSVDYWMRPGGRVVLLVGRDLVEVVRGLSMLHLNNEFPLLVNGKKASLLLFEGSK